MEPFKLVTKKTFESIKKFEQRLNKEYGRDWRAVSMVFDNMQVIVLLERKV